MVRPFKDELLPGEGGRESNSEALTQLKQNKMTGFNWRHVYVSLSLLSSYLSDILYS